MGRPHVRGGVGHRAAEEIGPGGAQPINWLAVSVLLACLFVVCLSAVLGVLLVLVVLAVCERFVCCFLLVCLLAFVLTSLLAYLLCMHVGMHLIPLCVYNLSFDPYPINMVVAPNIPVFRKGHFS